MDLYDREWEVRWRDGTIWFLSWFQDAGSFMVERWYPDDSLEGPYIECPGPEGTLFDDLDTLEAAMGKPLPTGVRQELADFSECFPFTDELRAEWGALAEHAITRTHPNSEFIETFAPPCTPDPFAVEWLPERMT